MHTRCSKNLLRAGLLLPVWIAACGSLNQGQQDTSILMETPGLPLTLAASAETVFPVHSPISLPPARATASSTATEMALPTPMYVLDLSRYDPDLFQPIDVSHNPPLISGVDETVTLVFDFANIFCMHFPVTCLPEGVLHYAYGEGDAFQAVPLAAEIVNEMESLVARLPATGPTGGALRYFAEFSVPEAGYTLRYPTAGTIDLFATSKIILVELPAEKPVEPGEVVYDYFWGYGPDMVRQATYEGYPRTVGPPALDVAEDGRIALLDPVNERILVHDPDEGGFSSLPLPFAYRFSGDIAFDRNGQVIVLDLIGEEVEGSVFPIPHIYRLLPDGGIDASGPVFVKSPSIFTRDLMVFDYYDSRLVVPFNPAGEVNSRETQREKRPWEFPYQYVEGQAPYVVRFADVEAGIAFEVHSVSPLGAILGFGRTPQGYLMLFELYDQVRAVWIDPAGAILKDLSLPAAQHTEVTLGGQVAVTREGSLYVLSSTERGIEVHVAGAPGD